MLTSAPLSSFVAVQNRIGADIRDHGVADGLGASMPTTSPPVSRFITDDAVFSIEDR